MAAHRFGAELYTPNRKSMKLRMIVLNRAMSFIFEAIANPAYALTNSLAK
jgi:hypothetical protein